MHSSDKLYPETANVPQEERMDLSDEEFLTGSISPGENDQQVGPDALFAMDADLSENYDEAYDILNTPRFGMVIQAAMAIFMSYATLIGPSLSLTEVYASVRNYHARLIQGTYYWGYKQGWADALESEEWKGTR